MLSRKLGLFWDGILFGGLGGLGLRDWVWGDWAETGCTWGLLFGLGEGIAIAGAVWGLESIFLALGWG